MLSMFFRCRSSDHIYRVEHEVSAEMKPGRYIGLIFLSIENVPCLLCHCPYPLTSRIVSEQSVSPAEFRGPHFSLGRGACGFRDRQRTFPGSTFRVSSTIVGRAIDWKGVRSGVSHQCDTFNGMKNPSCDPLQIAQYDPVEAKKGGFYRLRDYSPSKHTGMEALLIFVKAWYPPCPHFVS